MLRIDPASADELRLLLLRCAQRGSDPIRALDERGWALYPARLRRIRADFLRQLIETVRTATPTELGGGHVPATGMDMRNGIIAAMERMAAQLEEEVRP